MFKLNFEIMRQSYEKFRFAFSKAASSILSDRLVSSLGCKWSDLYSSVGISKSQFSSWNTGTVIPSFAAALAFFDSCGYSFKLVKKDDLFPEKINDFAGFRRVVDLLYDFSDRCVSVDVLRAARSVISVYSIHLNSLIH